MDCPNDRYVNDEAICQAVAAMLARVGVKIKLQRPAEGQVLRQGAGGRRLRHLVLPARLDARLVRLHGTCSPTCPLPRRQGRRRQQQSRRLLQSEGRRARPTRSWSRADKGKREP